MKTDRALRRLSHKIRGRITKLQTHCSFLSLKLGRSRRISAGRRSDASRFAPRARSRAGRAARVPGPAGVLQFNGSIIIERA
jgi:hypothetical protein